MKKAIIIGSLVVVAVLIALVVFMHDDASAPSPNTNTPTNPPSVALNVLPPEVTTDDEAALDSASTSFDENEYNDNLLNDLG